MKLTAEQAMFYLFQFFQQLGTHVGPLVETFLLDYAKESPLFSHNLIWHCKLEANTNPEDDNYFQQHAPRRATAAAMIDKVMEGFSAYEKNVFEELDRFLERVTDISSAMEPTMPTDVKLQIIEEQVSSIKVPALAYLPTNPSMQVVSIVRGSGRAMQSKAKCPFLLAFICKPFEGIDKVIKRRKQNAILGKLWADISERPKTAIEIRNFTTNFGSVQSSSSSIRNSFAPAAMELDRKLSFASGKTYNNLERLNTDKSMFSTRKVPVVNDGVELPSAFKNQTAKLKNFDEMSQIAFSRMSNVQTIPDSNFDEPKPVPVASKVLQESGLFETLRHTEGYNKDHKKIACIFKTKDDIRQDFLTLQFITLLKQAFKIEKSSLLLTPYRVFSNRTGDVDSPGLRAGRHHRGDHQRHLPQRPRQQVRLRHRHLLPAAERRRVSSSGPPPSTKPARRTSSTRWPPTQSCRTCTRSRTGTTATS